MAAAGCALLGLSQAAFAYSIDMSASASCIETSIVMDSEVGVLSAHCDHTVNINNIVVRKNGDTTGDATATAGYRSIGVSATATANLQTNFPEDFGATVSASARLEDLFFMDARLPDGTPVTSGFLDINVVTNGLVSLQSDGSDEFSTAHLDYLLVVGQTSIATNWIDLFPGSSDVPVSALLTGTIFWQAGQPIQILMQASASTNANLTFNGTVNASADFGHTMEWLGITNVTDEFGNPVASFSALSPEGLDWGSAAVPLPAAVYLFASGLLLLLRLARKRA